MMELTEAQERWVQALESGKYAQATGGLRREFDAFCCLGVACEIDGRGSWHFFNYRIGGSALEGGMEHACVLPEPVAARLGITEAGDFNLENIDEADAKRIRGEDGENFNAYTGCSLLHLNDTGWTFPEIAAFIRRNIYELARLGAVRFGG